MKQQLLKTLALGLMAMVGVNAWADNTIYPSEEVNYRPKSDKSGFDSSTPKSASETNNKFEVNHNSRFFALQRYTVPNLTYVKSLRLTLKGTSSMAINELAIWVYNSNTTLPTTANADNASALFTAYKTVTGVDLGATGTNTTTYLLKDAASGNSTDGDVKTAYFDISGDALTALKNAASDGTITLLITNKTDHVNGNSNQKREYFTSGHATESLRPTLTPSYYVYNATAKTTHDDLNTAVSSATDADTEIQLFGDATLSGRVTWSKTHTLTINPMVDNISIKRGTLTARTAWFLTNTGSTTILTLGNSTHQLMIDGGSTNTYAAVFQPESNSKMNITNVKVQNFNFGNETDAQSKTYTGYLAYHKAGYMNLDNLVVDNCSSSEATGFFYSEDGSDSRVQILTGINFNNCTGTAPHFSMTKRIQISPDKAKITIPTHLTINWRGATTLGTNVVVKLHADNQSDISLTNDSYGLYYSSSGGDLQIGQAYNLSVGGAGAATLVLPYESTIPSELSGKVYKLEYTSGNDINATAENTTLAANSAVLVVADEGSYKFIATSNDASTGSGQTSAYGVLIGNYTADYVVPATDGGKTNYILTKHDDVVAFRKVSTNNKVQPYRAYMSVTYNSGSSQGNAPAFFGIDFGTDGTTAIEAVEKPVVDDGEIYNLQGVRMTGSNLPKGIYVKNGKKFVVK